jgi:CDGSH-type Zn-finger protein
MTDIKISVRDNGPFLVSGPITLEDADGNRFDLGDKATVALCRCGASENRPFCDGSHKNCDFKSAERANG